MSIPDAARERIAMAYYYIWYTKGWFDGSAVPRFKATMADVHPVIGPYDSQDPDVIAAHMEQCRRARLDAIAVSWWAHKSNTSWLQNGAGRDVNQDDILESVMTIAGEHGLRATIILEAYTRSAADIRDALAYYIAKYRNDPRALHADGRPVICSWNTWVLGVETWAEIIRTLRADGLNAFHIATNQPDTAFFECFDALDIYTPLSPGETVMEQYTRLRADVDAHNLTEAGRAHAGRWHATVMPGFEDRLMTDRLERDDYVHFRDRRGGHYYWETFAAAMASRPEWLHVTSFNELAEHSHIENTTEHGDRYLRLTAQFAEDFKARVC